MVIGDGMGHTWGEVDADQTPQRIGVTLAANVFAFVPMSESTWSLPFTAVASDSLFTHLLLNRTLLYGFYQGKLFFIEPMVTRAHLETNPSDTLAVKQPQAYQKAGYYPTTYTVTTITYTLPQRSAVTLVVFDALGREVARLTEAEQAAGVYTVRWHAGDAPSGVYFYRLQAGDFAATRRLLLVK